MEKSESAPAFTSTEFQAIIKQYGDSDIIKQISGLVLNLKEEVNKSLLTKAKTHPLTAEEVQFLATPIKRRKTTTTILAVESKATEVEEATEATEVEEVTEINPQSSVNKSAVITSQIKPQVKPQATQFTFPEFTDELINKLNKLKII